MKRAGVGRVVRSAFVISVVRIGNAVAVLWIFALASRALPPAEFARLAALFYLATFLAIFARFGMDHVLMGVLPPILSRRRAVTKVVFRILLPLTCGAGLVLLVSGLAARMASLGPNVPLIVLAVHVPLFAIGSGIQLVCAEVLRAGGAFAGATLFQGALQMILALGLLMLGSSESLEAYWEVLATSAMLATLAGLVAAGRVVLRAGRGDEPSAAPEPAVPPIRASWRAGAGFTAAAVVFFLLNQSDVWLANLLLESERAAHYAAAARLVVLVSFGLSLVNAVASPSLARAAGRPDWAHFSRLLRAASAVGMLAGMVILIPLLTFPEVVLGRLYAASYAEGASVLRVLLIGQAVSLLVGSCGTALLVLGEHRGVLVSALVGIAGTGLGLLVASGGDFSAEALAASFAFGTVCYQLALYGFLRMRGADSLPSFRSVFRLIRASPGSGG